MGFFRFLYENVYSAASAKRQTTWGSQDTPRWRVLIADLAFCPPVLASGIDVSRGFSENLLYPCILTTRTVTKQDYVAWTIDKYAHSVLIGIAGCACQQIQ